ncbi:MAG TPA: dihydrodipicolinate synthase family protein [Streptosporangiaceae bacterium]|nr:dihydrodipicolinate synthase family protein [Streptosporangiaceae bacterium]
MTEGSAGPGGRPPGAPRWSPVRRDTPPARPASPANGCFSGTWYVMPTTFAPDGSLDLVSQRSLTEAVLSWGVDGLTVLGVMGEASTLDTDERAAVIRAVVTAAAGTPVAVGASSSARHTTVALVRQAGACGASAAMVAAPPLLRAVDSLPAFFAHVADGGGLPLILQDEPAATGVLLPVSVLVECLRVARISTVKLEDPPTPTKISAVLGRAPAASVFGGLGGVSSYFELRRGAVGTMTGFSYPEVLRQVRTGLEAGDRAAAYAAFAHYLPLISFEAQPAVGLGIRKELLRRRGVITDGCTRIGAAPSARLCAELDEVLDALRLRPAGEPLIP